LWWAKTPWFYVHREKFAYCWFLRIALPHLVSVLSENQVSPAERVGELGRNDAFKAAAAHVQTLKQNQRKKKLSMTSMEAVQIYKAVEFGY
jgi:hypothetical protein